MLSLVMCRGLFRLMRRYFLGRWICLLVSERLRLVWQCCLFGCNTYIQFCVHWHNSYKFIAFLISHEIYFPWLTLFLWKRMYFSFYLINSLKICWNCWNDWPDKKHYMNLNECQPKFNKSREYAESGITSHTNSTIIFYVQCHHNIHLYHILITQHTFIHHCPFSNTHLCVYLGRTTKLIMLRASKWPAMALTRSKVSLVHQFSNSDIFQIILCPWAQNLIFKISNHSWHMKHDNNEICISTSFISWKWKISYDDIILK